jgi:uncharacterized protein (TIGR02466 family)
MEPFNLFESVIWKGHYDGDLSGLKDHALRLLSTSKKLNDGLERDGGKSSSSDPNAPHSWTECRPFVEWLVEPTSTVWDNWQLNKQQPRQIGSSWVNIHPKGAWTAEHQHGSSAMVVVLYINQPQGGGNLEILDPLLYNWSSVPGRLKGVVWREIPVQTGDVVIFPGWVMHRTQKNTSDEDRVVASFNIGFA